MDVNLNIFLSISADDIMTDSRSGTAVIPPDFNYYIFEFFMEYLISIGTRKEVVIHGNHMHG